MAKNMMRGGTASVFASLFFKANNKECPDLNPDQSSTCGLVIDAINFYGSVMQAKKLPMRNFQLTEHIQDKLILNQILKTSEDYLFGYIIKVDLEYPEELHDSP